MKRDLLVQWCIFLGIAAFMTVIGTVYWFVSYEEAGTTMLALAACLAALVGGWLLVQDRQRPTAADAASKERAPYLPTASVWPLVLGVGAALALNGLVISWPYAVPGVAVIGVGVAGWIGESRRRS